MKAEELLRQYRQGERNFVEVNLRGQSFQGQDLSGVDFSKADIRGANFSDATLIGVNFCRVEAGLQFRWVIISQLLLFLLAGFAGFLAVYNGAFVASIFSTKPELIPFGWMSLVLETAFFAILLHLGISVAITVVVIVAVALALAIIFVGPVAGGVTEVFFIAIAVAIVIAGVVAGAGAVAEASAEAVFFAIAGAFAGAEVFARTEGVYFAIASILISAYVGWLAVEGNSKYTMIKSTAIAFAAWKGTSFRGADLTDANFNHAQLKSVDLRKAILTRTSWFNAHNLDCLRPGTSFLGTPQIRTLVETGQGQGADLTDKNLRGINLTNAQLENANFKSADLSEATLVEANLTKAKLIQTKLDQTNLTGAILTGVTIEDWGITRNTNLQGVSCKYVYMRQVNEDDLAPNPRRKPDNYEETFADGEFSDFIKPIVDTLDLYHNSNVDPHTIAIAFKKFVENNPDAEIQIASMEAKGKGNLLLRTKTASTADHSKLSKEYFETLKYTKTLSPEANMLLAEKEREIHRLSTMFNNFMESAMDKINTVNINAGGDISGIINLGEMSGDLNNSIQQLPDPTDTTQPNLKDLLRQLQTAIAAEPELDDTEKAAALAQVKKLAEAGQAPQDSQMKQLATKAAHFLKGIAAGLTEGAKLVTAWDKVGPAIMSVFGLL